MKKSFVFTRILLISFSLFSCQSQERKLSVKGTSYSPISQIEQQEGPDTIFTFKDGSQISITGYSEMVDGRKLFSEFNLKEYKSNKLIEGWSAIEQCEIFFLNDTLHINQLGLFALGKKNKFETHAWKLNHYFKVGKEIKRSTVFNKKLKLGKAEIESTLKDYESTVWQTQIQSDEEYIGAKMNLANRLMLAAISGNKKGSEYFKEFKTKFKPDGANAEWYNEMKVILDFARSKN